MALEIRKQERESSSALVRRFIQRFQKSGILLRAKSRRFFISPKSKGGKKKAALRRVQLKKEFEFQKKMAKPE